MDVQSRKNELKNIKKRLVALALATGMTVSMGGCSNNKGKQNQEESQTELGYLIEYGYEAGLYTYIINKNGLKISSKLKSQLDLDENKEISYARVVDVDEFSTNVGFFDKENFTPAWWGKHFYVVWPDCYDNFSKHDTKELFDINLRYEEIKELDGSLYTIIYFDAVSKKDWQRPKDFINKRRIYQGDTFSSIAICYNGKIIAYKQSGAGCDCENVTSSIKGDVDLALLKVDVDSVIEVSYDDLYSLQKELNKQKKK